MFFSVFLEEGQRKEPKLGVKGERGAEKGTELSLEKYITLYLRRG